MTQGYQRSNIIALDEVPLMSEIARIRRCTHAIPSDGGLAKGQDDAGHLWCEKDFVASDDLKKVCSKARTHFLL